MRTYTDLVPTFPDQNDWTLATVLRHQPPLVRTRSSSTCPRRS